MSHRTTDEEGLLTPAQVKAMGPAEMANFLRRNSGDANFRWQVREAILNRAAQTIDDLSTKLTAAGEAMARSNREIERLGTKLTEVARLLDEGAYGMATDEARGA